MKRIYIFLVFLLATVGGMLHAETPVYNMGTKDGSNGEQTVDGSLLFYDKGGPTGTVQHAQTGFVTFKSKTEGDPLTIEFTAPVNFTQADSHLYIYEGSSGYPSSGGWKKPVPEGYKADLTNGATFTYTANTGVIEVLYYAPSYSEKGNGWEAKLSTAPPTQMQWQGILSYGTPEGYFYPGVKDCALLQLDMTTNGSMNPLSATSLGFSLSGTALTAGNLENVRCLYGTANALSAAKPFGQAIATPGATLTFKDTAVLKGGQNYFWLVADAKSDATPGNTLKVSATSAIVSDTARISEPLTPEGELSVANMIFMPKGKAEYTVTELPINFYDDGGPTGKYSENFTGTTVFRPGVQGKKVSISFTNLDLFNNSSAVSVGNNDVIKVYKGTEAVDSCLLATVIENDPVEVLSTAADGALTVTFASKTGYPTQGFEALVSLFTPQPMSVDTVSAEATTLETVSAAEQAAFLNMTLHTVNSEPAAKAEAFTFSIEGTENLAAKATVYYGTTAVGETEVKGNTVTVTPATPVSLRQGNNVFRLDLTMNPLANTGDSISVSAESVTVNGATKTFGPNSAFAKVQNVALSKEGTHTYTVHGPWQFKNSPSEYSYYGYDATGEQITVFKPGKEGYVTELDFTKIYLYYPYSGSPHPALTVYDGEGTGGRVLYDVTKSNNNTLPASPLRGTTASGALTVRFYPNGVRGTNSTNGFKANVNLYKSQPMVIKSVEGFQAPETDVMAAQTDVPVVGFKVVTEGDKNPLALNSVKVNLKGCGNIVKVVKLYATGADNTFSASAATLLATDTIAAGAETSTLTLAVADTLPERDSYFWVAYDMVGSLAADLPVDASLTEVKIGSQTPAITNADPEGQSLTKNIYFFRGNDDVVNVTGTMLFYDDGGPDGKYTTAHKGKVTFMPAEGQILKFRFRSFYTNVNDDFDVYNGASTATADRLVRLYSSKSNIPDVMSTADNGALTVLFNPSKNNINDGWAIEVIAFTPKPLSVDSVKVESVAPQSLLRGSENNAMLHVSMYVGGDKGSIDVSKLSFSAPDATLAGLEKALVYYTGTNTGFATNDLYATAQGNPLSFSGNREIKLPGIYHFWLAYDVKSDAESGEEFTAQLNSITVSGNDYTPANRLIASAYTVGGKHGNFVIGKSENADFATFKAAMEALKTGIDGPVVLEVEDGEYTELVQIDAIPGNSSKNTLTLRSQSRDRSKVVINYESYDSPRDYRDQYGVLTLNGIDYATVEDLTFTTENVKFDYVVFVKGQSCNDTIRNCYIHAATTTSYSDDINLIRTYAEDVANCNNDNLTIEGCLLEGGYIGAAVGGTTNVSLPREKGAVIKGNTFVNQGSKGLYISGENDATITGNTVQHDGSVMGSSFNGMDIYRANGNMVCADNVFTITAPSSRSNISAIYLRDINEPEAGRQRVYNNDISITGSASTTMYGLNVANNDTIKQTKEIQYNTVVLSGTGGAISSGIYINAPFSGSTLRNNILQCEMKGYALRIQKPDYAVKGVFANNSLFSADTTTVGGVQANDYNFADFCSAINMTGAINEKAAFVAPGINELDSPGGFGIAIPVDYITADLNGTARKTANGAIGAYEYSSNSAAASMAQGYPQVGGITDTQATVKLKADRSCEAYVIAWPVYEETPYVEDVTILGRKVALRAGREGQVTVDSLSAGNEYKAYVVLRNFRGVNSGVIESAPFTTKHAPTAVSTFETVEPEGTMFDDGTAHFSGWKVIALSGAPGTAPAAKVAMMSGKFASVKPTNASALTLDGFYMRNKQAVKLTSLSAAQQQLGSKTIAPGEWRYISLRDMGSLAVLRFETENADSVLIDDFSGQPQDFGAAISFAPQQGTEGSQAQLVAYAQGGVWPYTVEWTDQSGKVLGNDLTLSTTLSHSMAYSVKVTDGWGNTDSDKAVIRVSGGMYPATFDDLQLAPESHWSGEENGRSSFFSGSWEFPNYYLKNYDSWAWCGYANSTSTAYTGFTDQFNNVAGGGDRSANYGVIYGDAYWGPCVVKLTSNAEGDTVPGISLVNTAWVKDAVLNGDGMSSQAGGFAKDDWFKLTLTGTRADNSTVDKEIYLADYRSADARDRYYIDGWQWFDLSDMGKLVSIKFAFSGTKSNSQGCTTPSYVCIDNLGAGCVRDTMARQTVQLRGLGSKPARLSLPDVLGMSAENGTMTFALQQPAAEFALKDNGLVEVSGNRNSDHWLLASATQKGRTRYVAVPVHIDQEVGVGEISAEKVAVWPVPAREVLNVNVDLDGYTIDLYDLNGRLLLHQPQCSGHTVLNLDGVPRGTCLVRVTHAQLSCTRKIVVSK